MFLECLENAAYIPISMIEMQTVLIELLENFEFLPPPGNIEIIRAATGLMSPMYDIPFITIWTILIQLL